MIISKNEKKELISKLLKYIEKFSKITGLSNKSIGTFIRTFHLTSPFFIIFVTIHAPDLYVLFFGLFYLGVILMFIFLKGCFLSRIEMELLNDDFFVTDPFLEILRIEINNKNRLQLTYIVGAVFLIFYLLLLYIRYFY